MRSAPILIGRGMGAIQFSSNPALWNTIEMDVAIESESLIKFE
jgi:hypothetical protein